MTKNTSRRSFIERSGGVLTALSMPAFAGAHSVQIASAATPPFDAGNPIDNANGFVKVMGDLEGTPNWMIAEGRIYALEDGEMPVPLVGVHGLRYLKFDRDGDRFKMSLRDWGFYTHYATGELLETYENPYTSAQNSPSPLLTRYFSWFIGPDGQEMDGYTGEAWLIGRPLRMPWVFQGDAAAVTLELLVKYGDGGFGAEWVNLHTNTADFHNPDLTAAPMRFSWTGYSPWMGWLEMGDRPGRTLWNSNGIKTTTIADLKPEIRAVYDRFYPGSVDNPETFEKSGGTTSTSE